MKNKKSKTLLFFLLIILSKGFLPFSTWAQAPTIVIVDAASLQPVHMATIQCEQIVDNQSEVSFFTSNQLGHVSTCPCNDQQKVRMIIRHISYTPIDTIIHCSSPPDTIQLKVKDFEIEDIVVTAKNEGVRIIGDSIQFDLNVFRKPHHRNIKDILNDLPGVHVKKNGEVQYKGKSVGQILLNGKSTAKSQFAMINRVVQNEDLVKVQLFPESDTTDIEQTMNLNLVLAPNISWLGSAAVRSTSEIEKEGSISLIKTGETAWNHSAEITYSQIGDQYRPELNLLMEIYDGNNKYRNALNISKLNTPFARLQLNTSKEKETLFFSMYNFLYEKNKTQINFYARNQSFISTNSYLKDYYNISSATSIWEEKNTEENNLNSSLVTVAIKHKATDKIILRASSNYAIEKIDLEQIGNVQFSSSEHFFRSQKRIKNQSIGDFFGHLLFTPDSTWTIQGGLQYSVNDMTTKYNLLSDAKIYDISTATQSQNHQLNYNLNRNTKQIDIGTSIKHLLQKHNQDITWLFHHNIRHMYDESNTDPIYFERDKFVKIKRSEI